MRRTRAEIASASADPGVRFDREQRLQHLLLSQFNQIRGPALWPRDARNLDAALGGDGSALETEAGKLLGPAGFAGATTLAAISCADAPARKGSRDWPRVIKRLTRTSRLYGPVLGWWLWPPAPRGRFAARTTTGGRGTPRPNPILVIGTTGDPGTPYANAVHSAQLLGNAVLLTHEGYGHVSVIADPSACVARAYVDYLTDLITPPSGTVCTADQQPFDPGFG